MTIVKNQSLAEEITQNTFYKAMTAKHTYEGKSSEFTWLCSIAKNLAIDECRKNTKYASFDEATVKPLTFRMEKSANYPYHLLIMIYSFYIYAGTASFGGSHPNAFNFFKYAWIFRSALN